MQSNQMNLFVHGESNECFEIIDFHEYRIAYFSKKKNSSQDNEDSLFCVGNQDFFVAGVADGAGGHPKGREASYIIGEEILKRVGADVKNSYHVLDIIEQANEKVLALKVGAKSTLSLLTFEKDTLRFFSVGDSEILYMNSLGAEIYSNVPHSQVGYQIQAGLIDQQESLDDPERYIVNNLVGDPAIRIETTSKMTIKKGHSIVVGSDGLFDNVSHQELLNLLGGGVFEKGLDLLVDICKKQGENWKKDDDVSFIVIRKMRASNENS